MYWGLDIGAYLIVYVSSSVTAVDRQIYDNNVDPCVLVDVEGRKKDHHC